MDCPAGQDVTAVARTVFAVAVHALVTYWLPLGAEQVVHELALLTASVYVLPAEHALHTPSVPAALELPAA